MQETNLNININKSIRNIFSIFLNPKFRLYIIAMVIINVILGVVPSIDSLLLQSLVDNLAALTPNNHAYDFLGWIIVYALWWEGQNVYWRLYDWVYLKKMPIIKAFTSNFLYEGIQNHDSSFFQENLTGEISSKITNASNAIDQVYVQFIEVIVRQFSMIVISAATLCYVNETIGLIFITWIFAFTAVSIYATKYVGALATNLGNKIAKVSGNIADVVANISVIKIFASHKHEKKYLEKNLENMAKADASIQFFFLKLRYILGVTTSAMLLCVLYYIFKLKAEGAITIGDCALILNLCLAVLSNIWDMMQAFGNLYEQIGIFNSAYEMTISQPKNDDKHEPNLEVSKPDIEFKNVNFNYKQSEKIFNNKNIYIPAYQKVGLVGYSGSGKTTFTKLIARLHEIEDGSISISGQDIRNVNLESLRKNISIIPQEAVLFNRSILENITYGNNEATFDEVVDAAKASFIHDVIMKLPKNYNFQCGERGNNLSIGQKQRVIIARAILKNAPILILDEATSSLDSSTEDLMVKSFKKLMEGKTVLVIAHRLSTLKDMDRILVFNNGSIVEDGTHETLKANKQLYQQLWSHQFKDII